MDPKLTEQLQQLLAALLSNAQDAATWTKGEIPLLIQEKIAFGRVWTMVMLVVLLVGGGVLYRFWRVWDQRDWNDDFNKGLVAVIPLGVPTLVVLLAFLVTLENCLQAWFAPRLYIVEWLIGMVATKPPR